MAKRPEPRVESGRLVLTGEDATALLAEIDGRVCLPCCGWWLERGQIAAQRMLRVCGRCGHWLMDFGDGLPVLLTQAEIEELPERAPRHAAEMARLTARLVDEAPCCKRALGHA